MIGKFRKTVKKLADSSKEARDFIERATQDRKAPRKRRRTTQQQKVRRSRRRAPTTIATPPSVEPPPQHDFATLTLAQLYFQQGKFEHAKSMLDQLDATASRDPAAVDLAQRVNAELLGRGTLDSAEDQVSLTADGDLACDWQISRAGHRGAELLLGQPGHVVLRLAGFSAAGTVLRDVAVGRFSGSHQDQPFEGALVVSAAIGLMGDDRRFVAIAHSPAVSLG